MKLVIQQSEALALASSFTRLHKHCVGKRLAAKEQLRLLMSDKTILIELSAGAIRAALEKLNETLATAPDSNGNYVILAPRKLICSLRDLVQGRLRLLRTQVIPAYEKRIEKGEALDDYLTTANSRVKVLSELEVKCLKALLK